MGKFLSVLVCVAILVGQPAAARPYATWTNRSIADQAYTDLISRMWYGAPQTGYIATLSHLLFQPLPPRTPFYPQNLGFAWWYGVGMTTIYAYWKETGSADALARLQGEWAWAKANYTLTNFSVCGTSHSATINFAQDDTAWNAFWVLELYDVTHDPVALTWAKAAIDCGYTEWFSTDLGGGLWYSDDHTSKSSYQGQFILDMLFYDQLAGNSTYLAQAVSLDAWMASSQRIGQTFFGNVFPNDGLYWADIDPTGKPFGYSRPYDIREANSVTLLEGSMAMAVVDGWLFQLTGDAAYQARVNITVSGMETYLVDVNGAFLDDRDAMTNSTAADFFARIVVPVLTGTLKSKAISMFNTTARLVYFQDRSNDGTYGGAWAGPNNGADPWTAIGTTSTQLNVDATAIMWPIANLAVQ